MDVLRRQWQRRASSSFQITSGNCAGVAQICGMLEGIPLALELAAALVRVLPVERIATRLNDRFSLPAGEPDARSSDRQTLQGMMEWSYQLLSAPEQTLLRRLSVFAEGCTLEAAEAVCRTGEDQDLLPLMTALVDKSLVNFEDRDARPRYRILATTRQYARSKLTAEESKQTADRHADFYTEFVSDAAVRAATTACHGIYALLEQEHHNILAALDWSATERSPEAELRLATPLCRFWYQRGYLAEGRGRIQHALERLKDAPPGLRAEALNGAGSIAFSQGDYTAALGFHAESLELYRSLGNRYAVAVLLADVGLAAQHQNEYAFAHSRYAEGLAIMTEIENLWGQGYCESLLGILAFDEEDYGSASSLLELGLPKLVDARDDSNVAVCLAFLGKIRRRLGAFQEALPPLLRGLTIRGEQGNIVDVACSIQEFGYLAWARGHLREAALLSGAAESLRELCAFPLPPNERSEYEAMVTDLQVELGPAQCANAWRAGGGMALEDAVRATKEYAAGRDIGTP